MDISVYGDDSKGLIRLDPRTKLFIFLISTIASKRVLRSFSVKTGIFRLMMFIFHIKMMRL